MYIYIYTHKASLMAQQVKICLQCRRHGRYGFNPCVRKIPWRRKMTTYSCILAWKIPWTEEPGGLQSKGLQRVRHDWVTKQAHTCTLYLKKTFTYWRLAIHVFWIDFPMPEMDFGAPSTFLGAKDRHLGKECCGRQGDTHIKPRGGVCTDSRGLWRALRKRNSTICESSLWVYYYYVPVHLLKMHILSVGAHIFVWMDLSTHILS